MNPAVVEQVVALRKRLPALLAHVRTDTGVDKHVRFQRARLSEALLADAAGVGPLPSVHFHVRLQAVRRNEPLAAVRAQVVLLAVYQLVLAQDRLGVEYAVADVAFVHRHVDVIAWNK